MRLDLSEIENRINELQAVILEKEPALEADDGTQIRISNFNGYSKYYLRHGQVQKSNSKSGTYIPQGNIDQVRKIVQRNYDVDVVAKAQKELRYLQNFLNHYPKKVFEDIYPALHPARKALISPAELTEEEFVEEWLSVTWDPLPFRPNDETEYYNKKGVRMKSKQETIMSNYFIDRDVPQRYEYPIRLKSLGEVHPDFMLLNKRTRKEYYWEHFGLWDNPDYMRKAVRKLVAYQRTGIYLGEQLIVTFETSTYHSSTFTGASPSMDFSMPIISSTDSSFPF